MVQKLHPRARTTEEIRREIQNSKESLKVQSERYGVNFKTILKWKHRGFVHDMPMGKKNPRSTVLTPEEEAICVAFRKHTLLPLDDCLYSLQEKIPHLSRSSLHRLFKRNGINRLPQNSKALAHVFDRVCAENGIEHRLTKPAHPWTNGQVERMNKTIKEATVYKYYYDSQSQLREHLQSFIDAYNFAKRLKAIGGLTPWEFIVNEWKNNLKNFKTNPNLYRMGLNN